MGHFIQAIITPTVPFKSKLETLELPLFVENGFHIIPLDTCHIIYWGKKWGTYTDRWPFFGIGESICLRSIEKIAKELGIEFYALIATNYHGGMGDQVAHVYRQGSRLKMSDKEGENAYEVSINEALRALGLKAKSEMDEFDTLRLGKYRYFGDYFEKYERFCDEEFDNP